MAILWHCHVTFHFDVHRALPIPFLIDSHHVALFMDSQDSYWIKSVLLPRILLSCRVVIIGWWLLQFIGAMFKLFLV